MTDHESIGNRFKIWRSKQPIWMNIIIGWVLAIKDFIVLMLIGLAISAVVIIGFMWVLQQAFNLYSGQ